MQHRSAARSHRVDRHHRHAQAHARHFGFICAVVSAIETRHIGGGAAHVEPDDMIEPRLFGGLRHADHTARRARNNCILAAKELRRGQPAIRCHEQQPRIIAVIIAAL